MGTKDTRRHFILESFTAKIGEVDETVTLSKPIPVYLPEGVDEIDLWGKENDFVEVEKNGKIEREDRHKGFPPFKNWLRKLVQNLKLQDNEAHTFHKNPYRLLDINIQAADWFKPKDKNGHFGKIGFVKLQSTIRSSEGKGWIPGAVFLRGGSVGMLMILQPMDVPEDSDKEKYVILTIQPRVAAASLAFAEIPAGMIENGNVTGTAVSEIEEETGLKVKENDLIALSESVVTQSDITPWKKGYEQLKDKEVLENAMYPSMGACDEFLPLRLWQRRVPREKLKILQGKATGLRDEGENITLKLVPLDELCVHAGRDGKALAAYALYQYHKGKGTADVKDMPIDELKDLKESTKDSKDST